MNAQTLIVVFCVLAAFVYLVRPPVRRWLAQRAAGPVAVSVRTDKAAGPACGGCKGCGSASGGCH
ncbi:hypothetical protein [Hydrogenophaga sp. RWCD_12]|uniref:hypothetical protein n=1 Tax=Hydrogenophaga sp. RWCD_12 TaxID=3391190 RepID=UPI00398473B0